MSSDFDYLSAASYADGTDPISWAETRIAMLLSVRDNVRFNRPPELPPLPAWSDLGDDALSRKILGTLLDAGWRPPPESAIQAAIARVRAEREQFEAWKQTLPPGTWDRVIRHYSRTGEWPPDVQRPSGPLGAS